MDAVVMTSLPPIHRRNTNSRVPSLQRHYPPSALLRTHPPPSRRPPTSRGTPGYRAYPASAAFATGRGRLLQLLDMSWSPCCPYHPAEVTSGIGQIAACHAAFARNQEARPSELFSDE